MIRIHQNVINKKSGVMEVFTFDLLVKTADLYQIPKLINFNLMVPGVTYIDRLRPVPSLPRKLDWPPLIPQGSNLLAHSLAGSGSSLKIAIGTQLVQHYN